MQKMNKGAAKAGLNFNDVKFIRVPLPPINLQEKFTEVLTDSQSLKQKMDEQSQLLETQFQSFMQKSFSLN